MRKKFLWLKTCLLNFMALCVISLILTLSSTTTTTTTILHSRPFFSPPPSPTHRLHLLHNGTVATSASRWLRVERAATSRSDVARDVISLDDAGDVSYDDAIDETSSASLPSCPDVPPHLVGFKPAVVHPVPLSDLETQWRGVIGAGGDYRPPDCRAKNRTAIIIPCRNRWAHLRVLLNHLIPFLVRQQVSFTFFVIESDQASHFNKGILMNAGYVEALRRSEGEYSCFVFQDVDLLPLNDHNLYRCGPQPTHLAGAIDKFHYRLPYREYFGGVLALSRDQVEEVNGHSNVYFGWGGEDDDLFHRVRAKGYRVRRKPMDVAQYHMLRHDRDRGNEETEQKLPLLRGDEAVRRMEEEGMRQVVYGKDWEVRTPLFTWLKITINQTQVIQNSPHYVRQLFKHGVTLHTNRPPARSRID